jgi:hypothetical protein
VQTEESRGLLLAVDVPVRVLLRSVLGMLDRMQLMAMRQMGVVAGLIVVAGFIVFGGLAVMLGRVLVVLGGFQVVMMDRVLVHFGSPEQLS